MCYQIRTWSSNDLPEILLIEQSSHLFPWTQKILSDCLKANYLGWVAIKNNCIVAYLIVSIAANECHILNLCVLIESRKQGYARALMQTALEYAKQKETQFAFLEVRASNTAALNLYRQLGFKEIGLRKAYYPSLNQQRENAIILSYEFISQNQT